MKLRSLLLWPCEKIGAEVLSKFFWPPAKVSVLVFQEGKVLAVDTGDYLMLPGGLVEAGETFEAAARRELLEETGLQATDLERVEENIEHLPGIEAVFSAQVEGELSGSWEGRPRWIGEDQVSEERWRFDRDIGALLERRKTS